MDKKRVAQVKKPPQFVGSVRCKRPAADGTITSKHPNTKRRINTYIEEDNEGKKNNKRET